jgi:hypothetical protein
MSGRRPGPLRLLGGHLGSSVSALVDGQLDADATERGWQHVAQCTACRRLVEHEGWVKRQLAQIADGPRSEEPSDRFLGSLLDLDPTAVAWADTQEIEDRSRTRRRAGIALVGAGSVSAAVLGLTTLGGAPLGWGGGGTPASSIGGSSRPSPTAPVPALVPALAPTASPTVVSPLVDVRGRLPGWTLVADRDGVVHATAVRDRR